MFAYPYSETFGTGEFPVVTYAKLGATARPQTLLDYGTVKRDRYFTVKPAGEGRWRAAATGEEGTVSYATDASP